MAKATTVSIKKLKSLEIDQMLQFEISDIDVSHVNAIRRVILAEIPTIAIAYDPYKPKESDIQFVKNNSVLHNEFVGHRLSIVPLYFKAEEIDAYDPDQYKFVIHKKNTTTESIDVTTDDIRYENNYGTAKPISEIFPRDPLTKDPIIISKLKPNIMNPSNGEELHIVFSARKDIAKKHARWCAVSTCVYENTMDEERVKLARENITDSKLLNAFDSIEKYRIFKTNKYGEPNSFKFTIVSECALTPKEILLNSVKVIRAKLAALVSEEGKYEVQKQNDLYIITVHEEDHTLGNLVQSYIYNKYVRESSEIEYVGYYQPHPLESDIIFKLKPTPEKDGAFAFDKFSKGVAQEMMQSFDDIGKFVTQKL